MPHRDFYWVTVEVTAESRVEATEIAARLPGRVIDVQLSPPQGSMIVGDMQEDGDE